MSLDSVGLITPSILESLSNLSIHIENFNIVSHGGVMNRDRAVIHCCNGVVPREILDCILDGLKHPQIEETLKDLTKELNELVLNKKEAKSNLLNRITATLGAIRATTDTVTDLRPYFYNLYKLTKPFIEEHVRVKLP